ncbi:hypothetical protein [Streptomyces sp. NPDC000878]
MTTYWGHGGPYETWVDFLRRWSAEEDVSPEALPPLDQEDFPGETWTRLAGHLGTALDARLTAWANRLTEALLAASDEFSVGRALAQARTGLSTVRAVAGHPGLPESTRTRFTELVEAQITDLQRQLERQLDELAAANGTDQRWVEQRRRTFRDNPLTVASSVPVADPWAQPQGQERPKRRVITDT